MMVTKFSLTKSLYQIKVEVVRGRVPCKLLFRIGYPPPEVFDEFRDKIKESIELTLTENGILNIGVRKNSTSVLISVMPKKNVVVDDVCNDIIFILKYVANERMCNRAS